MNKKMELAKNTFIIFVGKLSTQFLTFLLLPLYTTFLNTSEYGTVDLILTYVSLLVPVISLQLEMSAFRFLIDNRDNEESNVKIVTNVLALITKFTFIFIILYLIISFFFDIPYKIALLLNIVCCIFANLFLQIARGLGKNTKYSIACIVTGITTFVLNIILIIFLKTGAVGILISGAIANIFCIIYLICSLNIRRLVRKEENNKKIRKELIKYSWPLVPNGISWWLINASDRTIVSVFLGVSMNGIYAVSTKFATIVNSLFSIFSLSWTESASIHINDDDRNDFFSEITDTVIRLFSSLCILLIGFMPIVFNIFVNSQYKEAYKYIPITMIGALFNCIVCIYSAIYIAQKRTKQVASTSIFSAVINIVVDLVLIRYIGLFAASISTAVAYFVMAIYRGYDLRKTVKIKYNKKLIAILVIAFVINITLYYSEEIYFVVINMLFSLVYAIFINKELLITLKNKLEERLKNYSINKYN